MDLYEITRASSVNGEPRSFLDYVVASSIANAAQIHAQTAPEGLVLSMRGLGSVLAIEAEGEDVDAVSQMGFRLQEDDDGEAEEELESLRCRQGAQFRGLRKVPKR